MKLKALFLAALVVADSAPAASVPANKAQIELVREAMQSHLKDADSAKFRNVRLGTGVSKGKICGDVNAKNSFGAYIGFVTFFALYNSPEGYTDSKTPMFKPFVVLIGIDDDSGGGASILCDKEGL